MIDTPGNARAADETGDDDLQFYSGPCITAGKTGACRNEHSGGSRQESAHNETANLKGSNPKSERPAAAGLPPAKKSARAAAKNL